MPQRLDLGGIAVDVVFKDIKNVHLSVHPPTGRVRISAPERMSLDTIRLFAISKLGWIKQERGKFQDQERESPREYLDRESHYVWGRRYLLSVVESDAPGSVEIDHKRITLKVRSGSGRDKREALLAAWYRDRVREAAMPLIAKWEPLIDVNVRHCFVQRMKTKWGSCSPENGSIRLNTELGRKPLECLEYVIVHEMVHLRIRHHDDRFRAMMDRRLPNWETLRDMLNSAPLAHVDWVY